jgi:anti-sigma factor (TIGR02949 family)
MSDPDTIACDEALRRLAEFVDHELADEQRDEMDRHIHTCRSCYSRVEFERRLKQQLSQVSSKDASATAIARIRGLIRGFE